MSFVPDVFGANRRTVESLEAQAEDQRFQLEATYLTLTSNVVAAAVQEASLRGQIAANRGDRSRKRPTCLASCGISLQLGQVAGSDVAAQEAALAQAQQVLPPLQKQLAQQRDLLDRIWRDVSRARKSTSTSIWPALQLPLDLPVSLPAKADRATAGRARGGGEHARRQRADRHRGGGAAAADHADRATSATAPTARRTCSRPAPTSGRSPAA